MALLFDELKKDQLANPPKYDQQGMLVQRYTQPQSQVLGASIVAGQDSAFSTGGSTVRRNLPSTAEQNFAPLLTSDQFAAQRGGVDENAIRDETRKQMQAQINATNQYYADLVSRENRAGEGRLAKVNAINVNSGLGGSNFATSRDLEQRDLNTGAVRGIENERNVELQKIYSNIDKTARDEISARKAEALGNAEAYSTYLEKARTNSRSDMSALAGAGIDLAQLDENRRNYLLQSAGYDPELGSLVYNSLKPKQSQIKYEATKAADGQILLYGVDPTTGELKQQRIDFDVPEGYEPTYVDGQLFLKSQTDGSLMPAPMDESLYTAGYKDYLLSKKEGFAGDYNDYQTVDANRKRSLNVTNNIGGTDLNTKDRAVFNSLVDKANKSPLIAAADRTIILDKSIQDIKKTPGDAALQLNLSYAYIQALDTYQSAVREGELANLNSIDSKVGEVQGWVQQIQNGQIVRPEVATKIAGAAESIVKTIKEGAKAADKKFEAQAKTNGDAVGNAWNDYRSNFTASYDDPNKLSGETTMTDEEAYDLYLKSQQ